MDEKTKEALQKQLQLLSERSAEATTTNDDLCSLSRAMVEIGDLLLGSIIR